MRDGLTNVLARPPVFSFPNAEEKTQSRRIGPTVAFAEIWLRGYLQVVGDTAIRVETQPQRYWKEHTVDYRGLPGDYSTWKFDHEPISAERHYCLRVLEDAKGSGAVYESDKKRIQSLVLEKKKETFEELRSNLYKRVGVLTLYSMPKDHYKAPYPDIFFENGKPLLTDGSWEDIVLV